MITDKLKLPGIFSKMAACCLTIVWLVNLPVMGQESATPDSIKLVITDFEGSEAYDGLTLKQLGQMLANELNQFIIPVLPLDERDRRIDLLSDYQSYLPDSMRWDEKNPRPDYWSQGIITSSYISASIIALEDERPIASAKVKTKKDLGQSIELLAEELIHSLIKELYQIELDELSLMGVRLPRNADYRWWKPMAKKRGQMYWFQMSKSARAMVIWLEDEQGAIKEVGPYTGVKPQTLQMWRIKKGTLGRQSLVPMKSKLSLGAHYFTYREHSSAIFNLEYAYMLSGKIAIGAGLDYYRLPITTQVEAVGSFMAEPVLEEEYLLSPSLSVQYQQHSSTAMIFYGLQLRWYPVDKGGDATAFIGLSRLPWLRLELAARSFSTEVLARAFRYNQITATRTSIDERFLLISGGLKLSTFF